MNSESTGRDPEGEPPVSPQDSSGEDRGTSVEVDSGIDVPESVKDHSEDPTDRCGWWIGNQYLPRLRATRWVGFVPGSFPSRFFHVGCSLADSVMLDEYGPATGRSWCLIPTGSLGLRPATRSQANGRRLQLLQAVARVGGTAVTLAWHSTRDVPTHVASAMKDTEPAVLVLGATMQTLQRLAALNHQPLGLIAGPDGLPAPVDLRSGALLPSYVNSKGRTVNLEITRHARERLMLRSELLTPHVGAPIDVDWAIAELLGRAVRVTKHSIEERKRLGRYGGDTMFFRDSKYRLVVRNGAVITIEIAAKDKRELNRLDVSPNTGLGCAQPDPDRLRWRVFVVVPDPDRDWRVADCGWFDHPVPLVDLPTSRLFHRFLREFLKRRNLPPGGCRGVMVSRERNGPQVEVKVVDRR